MILIIINDLNQNKKANDIFTNILKPYLKSKKLDYVLTYSSLNLLITNEYKKYIFLGGDGTISYYINKYNLYCSEQDILCIPLGSGNGIAKNLNITLDNFIETFENNKINKVNLQEINYNNQLKYSFLFITWGLISDIDIDTEFLRYFGDLRFYYGIIKFLILGNTCNGKLIYVDKYDKHYETEGKFSLFCSSFQNWISNDFNMIPNSKSDYINLIYINKNITFFERCKLLYYLINETHIDNCDFVNHIEVKKYSLQKFDDTSKFVYDGELLNTDKINVKKNYSLNFYDYN